MTQIGDVIGLKEVTLTVVPEQKDCIGCFFYEAEADYGCSRSAYLPGESFGCSTPPKYIYVKETLETEELDSQLDELRKAYNSLKDLAYACCDPEMQIELEERLAELKY